MLMIGRVQPIGSTELSGSLRVWVECSQSQVSHERDLISVTEHDGPINQSLARNSQISVDHLDSLNLDAVAQPFLRSAVRFNDVCGYVTMNMRENLMVEMGRLQIQKTDRVRSI